ncbi:error-prone DNA polymerase [Undibacter mobilis]|uniref:Error-prone DNA polymerase n=1 Tax=Undibacter mobilis TaxID=2292256 RepID=A0A371B6T2_9BRAD|nr:error-prone DNA polymerase [Undibacter mobilis]RDV03306.1 DNA polymerase III subunit alpha [Undibacter mobilis]
MRYVEFATATNFSFLRGASHPEELMLQAQTLELSGIGVCDRNTVSGVVRAHLAKREQKLSLAYHPGARLVFSDGTPDILVYPRDRAAWGRLTRLLTVGNLRAKKGDCILTLDDLVAHAFGLELVVMPDTNAKETIAALRPLAPGRVRLAATMLYRGQDRARLMRLKALAQDTQVPLIAINDVHYHHPDRRPLADALTCIRDKVTIDRAGRRLAVNAERFLKAPTEMARLFRDAPEAIEETMRLSKTLTFSLDELKYEYPDETMVGFPDAQSALAHLVHEEAVRTRYPQGIPNKVKALLDHELQLIAEKKYAPYFLTVYDIVRQARSLNILCQGRGSAANSTVCYCLGITEVDPNENNLLFERFISTERHEPPDIDVDFEHERREEVIQYIYGKYGSDRAGIAGTVICYRGRSAIREVGKAFGLSEDTIGALSSSIWGGGGGNVSEASVKRTGLDPDSFRMKQVAALAQEISGFPRHLSQHVGGFVITRSRLDEVVPIGNGAMDERTFVEWDKDDLDALGILKVDVLGLGMLSCIRKAFDLMEKHYPEATPPGKRLATIPSKDEALYRMLGRADSLGVFQVESRAQMSMLPRLRPKEFYDLVIEVAIVRPGPIQGDMVHPYLRRRESKEKIVYPSKELEDILSRTLGVPLFQEQAMSIAIVAGGFTPGEADNLRRAMATFKRTGTIGTFRDKMIKGMLAKGYERGFAERCFSQIEGFGEYGFPESHAASFALLVYASAWLKCHYPDVFAAALLNAQPMGFYASSQIVRDAREHGVEVRAPDINHSDWDSTLEPGTWDDSRLHDLHKDMRSDIRTARAVRLGLREIKGMSENDAELIAAKRGAIAYDSVRDLWLRTGLHTRMLERLADADAFSSLGLTRRDALWAAKALGRVGDQNDDLPLFAARAANSAAISYASGVSGTALAKAGSSAFAGDDGDRNDLRHFREPDIALPPMPLGEEVVNDYRFLRLSLRAHPAEFLRADLSARNIVGNDALRALRTGARATISGLVTCRQRPGSAKGVVFMTLEDETSVANVIVWPKMFERVRPIVLGARYVSVTGRVQSESGVIHVVADEIEDLTFLLARLAEQGADIDSLVRADEVRRPVQEMREAHRNGGRESSLERLIREMPELAADLGVHAPGSAHIPLRSASARKAR